MLQFLLYKLPPFLHYISQTQCLLYSVNTVFLFHQTNLFQYIFSVYFICIFCICFCFSCDTKENQLFFSSAVVINYMSLFYIVSIYVSISISLTLSISCMYVCLLRCPHNVWPFTSKNGQLVLLYFSLYTLFFNLLGIREYSFLNMFWHVSINKGRLNLMFINF